MYRVLLHRRAFRDYERQGAKTKARLDESFKHLQEDPFRGTQIKRLSGELSHLYRYRIGQLRILYEVHENQKIVQVKAIASRGDIYK
jgi:mRNA interferase RelE/StbE